MSISLCPRTIHLHVQPFHAGCERVQLVFLSGLLVFLGVVMSHNHPQYYVHVIIPTSSTAQGGGGSFKNRKPIGEVCCCESRKAERIH